MTRIWSWVGGAATIPRYDAGIEAISDRRVYHFVTFSCYGRLPLLNQDEIRVAFERGLERLRRRHGFYVFGYVLMPEHVHMLVSELRTTVLASVIAALKRDVSLKIAKPNGHLWQRRYYDFNVFPHGKYVEKLRYMHRNPVQRGLVAKPEDWPWSSFRHYLTGIPGRVEIESEWTWNRRERGNSTHP